MTTNSYKSMRKTRAQILTNTLPDEYQRVVTSLLLQLGRLDTIKEEATGDGDSVKVHYCNIQMNAIRQGLSSVRYAISALDRSNKAAGAEQ